MARTNETEPKYTGKIQVRVSDFPNGLRVYDHIKLVRIKSSDYNLLIMNFYQPAVGKVFGSIEIVDDDGVISLGVIDGFFIHRNNVFSLLIENQLPDDYDWTKNTSDKADRLASEQELADNDGEKE